MDFEKMIRVNLFEKRKQVKELKKDMQSGNDALEKGLLRDSLRVRGLDDIKDTEIEQTRMYLEQLEVNKGMGFSPFVNPRGNVQKMLRTYGVIE